MSMICLTRPADFDRPERLVYVNPAFIASVERITGKPAYTRVELANASVLKVSDSVASILVQMGEWDMADSAEREEVAA